MPSIPPPDTHSPWRYAPARPTGVECGSGCMPSYPSWPRDGRTSSARTTGWRKGSAPSEDGPLPWQSGSRGGTPPLQVHACRTGRYDAVWFVPLPC